MNSGTGFPYVAYVDSFIRSFYKKTLYISAVHFRSRRSATADFKRCLKAVLKIVSSFVLVKSQFFLSSVEVSVNESLNKTNEQLANANVLY
jgi:hypothetical protein